MGFTLGDGALNITAVTEGLAYATEGVSDHATAVDKFFVLVSGFMVFLIKQVSLCLLPVPSVLRM